MGMNLRALLLLAAAVTIPASAFAGGAMGEARGAVENPAAFDGGSVRPDVGAVKAGSTGDRRSPEEIAASEQAKENARTRPNLTVKAPGDDTEVKPPKPNPWTTAPLIRSAVAGGIVGLLIGSLWGFAGMGIGVLVGAALFYGLTKILTKD